MCLQFVVYASLILDWLPFHVSKDFNWIDAPDKAIKQSRDLKYVLFLLISDLGTISYCAASCAGLQNQNLSSIVLGCSHANVERVNAQKSSILKERETYYTKGTLNTWLGTF